MTPRVAQVLVPPRPNPGPEPWPEPVALSPWAYALGIPALIAMGLLIWIWLRRQRRGRLPIKPPSSAVDNSPRGRLLRLAEETRQNLIVRFGPEMRARTTEEIAGDGRVKEALGAGAFAEMIHLLSQADLWKFATPSIDGHLLSLEGEISRWQELVANLGQVARQKQ